MIVKFTDTQSGFVGITGNKIEVDTDDLANLKLKRAMEIEFLVKKAGLLNDPQKKDDKDPGCNPHAYTVSVTNDGKSYSFTWFGYPGLDLKIPEEVERLIHYLRKHFASEDIRWVNGMPPGFKSKTDTSKRA